MQDTSAKEVSFSDMHAGDLVFECNQHHGSLQIRLLSDPARSDKGWTFKALSNRGEQEYLIDPDSQHLLGSYFYDRPLYEPVKLFTDKTTYHAIAADIPKVTRAMDEAEADDNGNTRQ